MNNKQKRSIMKMASKLDKSLSKHFQSVFGRSPEESDQIEVVELSFGFAMCLVTRPDEWQVFAFVQDVKVRPVSDFGYEHSVYYCPNTEQFYSNVS